MLSLVHFEPAQKRESQDSFKRIFRYETLSNLFTETFDIIINIDIYYYKFLNVFLSLRYMHVAVALIDLKKIHNVK